MIPAQAVQWAKAAQAQTGVSDAAAAGSLAVAGPESSYNPAAVGDNGSSFGLDQLHIGGLANGHPMSALMDPVQNLAIGMQNIQAALDSNGGDLYAALRPWSTRDLAWPHIDETLAALNGATAFVGSTSGGSPPDLGSLLVPAVLVVAALWFAGVL